MRRIYSKYTNIKQCPSGTLHCQVGDTTRARARGHRAGCWRELVLSSASHVGHIRGRARGGGGGAAPSVATAGRPRLERHCASQPRAPSEQDEHTAGSRAHPTILALETSLLIPIYLVHAASLMFLCDRKRVFTPRGDPVNVTQTLEIEMLRGLSYAMGRFDVMSLLNVLVPCCLAVNVFQPCTHLDHYDLQLLRDICNALYRLSISVLTFCQCLL